MHVLVVFGSQFGTTAELARAIGAALAPRHTVEVLDAGRAHDITGAGVDLVLVGAPTQLYGHRILVRPFLRNLRERGFAGVAAAAFDTHMPGASAEGAAAIGRSLTDAGLILVVPPEGFVVANFKGPLAEGEAERAAAWATSTTDRVAAVTPLR